MAPWASCFPYLWNVRVTPFFSLRLDHAEPDYVDEICPWNGDDCVVYRTTLAPTTTKAPTPKPEPSPEPNPEPTAEPEKQTTIKYVINCKSREILFRPNFRTPFLKKKIELEPLRGFRIFFSRRGRRFYKVCQIPRTQKFR